MFMFLYVGVQKQDIKDIDDFNPQTGVWPLVVLVVSGSSFHTATTPLHDTNCNEYIAEAEELWHTVCLISWHGLYSVPSSDGFFFSSNRCGSRTEGPNGGAKKRWTIPPWSSTILPCYPSIGPKCLPALGQLPTPCPSIHGWPRPSPVPHPCTRYQGSWDLRRACSPLTRATLSWTPLRVWSKACSRWAPLPTSVRPASPIRAQWRTTGVLASRHSGWKPKSTFSRWIKPGSTCDVLPGFIMQDDFFQLLPQSTVLLLIFIFVQPTREDRTLHQRSYIEINMGFIILKKITCKNIFLVYLHIFFVAAILNQKKLIDLFEWRFYLKLIFLRDNQLKWHFYIWFVWIYENIPFISQQK